MFVDSNVRGKGKGGKGKTVPAIYAQSICEV